MKRRTFLQYGAVVTSTLILPTEIEAGWLKNAEKTITVALYASNLNPVRLFSGLVFDKLAEVYVEPLAEKLFNDFIDGKTVSSSRLSYNSSSAIIQSPQIEYEPYKASIAVYGDANYEIHKREKLRLYLESHFDKKRFDEIAYYLKEQKTTLYLYDEVVSRKVDNSLELTDLLNLKYMRFQNNKIENETHIKNLLMRTQNQSFGELVV